MPGDLTRTQSNGSGDNVDDSKLEVYDAVRQLTKLGYRCSRTASSRWKVVNPSGVIYKFNITDQQLINVADKVCQENGEDPMGAEDPEQGQQPAGVNPDDGAEDDVNMDTAAEPEEIPVNPDGTVDADNIPIFKANPALKNAIAQMNEPVAVDDDGNLTVGETKIEYNAPDYERDKDKEEVREFKDLDASNAAVFFFDDYYAVAKKQIGSLNSAKEYVRELGYVLREATAVEKENLGTHYFLEDKKGKPLKYFSTGNDAVEFVRARYIAGGMFNELPRL